MPIQNVAIIGASGTLGPAILTALVNAKCFTITVLARQSSKATFPTAARTVRIPDDGGNEDQLASAMQGQDALVVTIPAKRSEDTIRLANACVKAGVRRMIPADFGSVDSEDEYCMNLVPLYGEKTKSRQHLQRLSAQHPSFSWTSLVNGHFFDWGLSTDLLGLDLRKSEATIFGDGTIKWCTSTLSQIGEAVVNIFQKENATKNTMLHMTSFYISQNELLAIIERISGEKFQRTQVDPQAYAQEQKKQVESGNHEALERLVGALGITRADWHGKLANDLLGLSPISLEDAVKTVWTKVN